MDANRSGTARRPVARSGRPVAGGSHVLRARIEARFARMHMKDIPFEHDRLVDRRAHRAPGRNRYRFWRTRDFSGIRVRMVEYTPGYLADHWCVKGHIILCLEGELHTELEDGRKFVLRPGMTYQVADNAEAHRSFTAVGAKLFVVD